MSNNSESSEVCADGKDEKGKGIFSLKLLLAAMYCARSQATCTLPEGFTFNKHNTLFSNALLFIILTLCPLHILLQTLDSLTGTL